jgi:integrase/recombinase XerD
MNSIASNSPLDLLVEEYQAHLLNVAGLKPGTCERWSFFVRLFLNAQFKPKFLEEELRQLDAQALLSFVLAQGEHYLPARLQVLASALRSFCRFLCVSGRHPRDLSRALPSIAGDRREELPVYLSPEQLDRVLGGFDRRTVAGKRDYALVLCLARLGLRVGEAARLSVDEVDWRNGVLRLRATKGRRERQLPLPQEVGQALTAYLRSAPPQGATRALFRSLYGPHSLSPATLSQRVGIALARAGVTAPGRRAHRLRHTCATLLVQQGVPLKAVADLLGHASLNSTRIYAKVNLPMLRAVAQPWPGEVRS